MTILLHRIRWSLLVTAVAAILAAGCSLDDQKAPGSLIGPSEFALSVAVTASPNQLPRDGSSQSVVTITVRNAEGRPVAGQRLSLAMPINVPSGTSLSTSEVTTDANGQAAVTVTAPSQGSTGNAILVNVIPVGSNLDNVVPRFVSITLTPTNSTRPTPSFTFNPTAPEIGQLVQFNASATVDEGVPCGESCTYVWDFGGEGSAVGRIVTHAFRAGGRYRVALTVTDTQGAAETLFKDVDVTTTGQPLPVSFTATCPPDLVCVAGRALTFVATATPAANHRIVSYNWSWGDGSTSQSAAPGIQHTFATAGTFLVRLTVVDDFGQSSEASSVVSISTGLIAEFINSAAVAGQNTLFDASTSVSASGSPIVLYSWNWGDGSSESTTIPILVHQFTLAGTYVVQLTITDGQGRTAIRSRSVTVAP
jgi:PKD repeat protein